MILKRFLAVVALLYFGVVGVFAAEPLTFTRSLFIGLRGDDVKALQGFLAKDKAIYPLGLVTGYFGPATEAAVKNLQKKYGIEQVGIVGPKTRAKIKELTSAVMMPPETKIPEQLTETPLQPDQPKESPIKFGSGVVGRDQYFNAGPLKLYYYNVSVQQGRGFLVPNAEQPPFFANVTISDYSACEDFSAKGYRGIKNICEFNDASKYNFTEHKEVIRIYDKGAFTQSTYGNVTCYQGILLFKQGNVYGAIEPADIDQNSNLNYNYWYDESGGSDFSSLCSSTQKEKSNLAAFFHALAEKFKNLFRR